MPPAASSGQRVFRPWSRSPASRSPEVSPATMPRRKASAGRFAAAEGAMSSAHQAAGAGRDELQQGVDIGVDGGVARAHGFDLGARLLQREALAIERLVHV